MHALMLVDSILEPRLVEMVEQAVVIVVMAITFFSMNIRVKIHRDDSWQRRLPKVHKNITSSWSEHRISKSLWFYPVHLAAYVGNDKSLKILLEVKADIEKKNKVLSPIVYSYEYIYRTKVSPYGLALEILELRVFDSALRISNIL